VVVTAERYVDADELAATFGVSRSTVKRWVAAGVPSETWGMRVRRFLVSEVLAWLRERGTLPTEQPSCSAARQRHGA
jgi:predicted DNA-binding transcriptional regulator AlpA